MSSIANASSAPVLIHEYVTGGGWPEAELPPALVNEGATMATAVLDDFRAWGRYAILTTTDRRLGRLRAPADEVVPLSPDHYEADLRRLVEQSQAVLLIAPETGGVLAELSAAVEAAGSVLLGSAPEAVRVAGDKWECHRRLVAGGVPTPKTIRAVEAGHGRPHGMAAPPRAGEPPRVGEPPDAWGPAATLGLPLVVKPRDGVGCEGVGMLETPGDVTRVVSAAREAAGPASDLLLQEYVPGAHASASLLVGRSSCRVLGLNRQLIEVGARFSSAGTLPGFQHPLAERAAEQAVRAAGLVPGLRGYVGVDLVVTDSECFVIEINPRITTSYAGLPRDRGENPAALIWEVCVGDDTEAAVERPRSGRRRRGAGFGGDG